MSQMQPLPLQRWMLGPHMQQHLYDSLSDAVCSGWSEEVRRKSRGAVDDIVFGRHDKAISFLLPWLTTKVLNPDTTIVDFGCGSGSSTIALARHYHHVIGIDIDEGEIDAAQVRARLLGIENVEFATVKPSEIAHAALSRKPDCIVFHAVIEHLTEQEKINYLRLLWRELSQGATVTITETPNRYAYFDRHTSEMPFFHLLPDELALAYIERSNRPGLASAFHNVRKSPDKLSELRHRLGLGVGYQDFEIGFDEDLNEITVGDGFDDEIIGMFPLDINDHLLLSYFDTANIPAPAGFARSVISAAFRKPASSAERHSNAMRNIARSKEIIAIHSLSSALRSTENRVRTLLGLQPAF